MGTTKTKSSTSFQDRSQRLFFALWPDNLLRQQLVDSSALLVQASSGRSVPAENFHITLAFLGNVDARQQACVERMAEAISGPSFEIMLDHFGHWPRPRVLWFAPSEVPEALVSLAKDLNVGAQECGVSMDARPYRPHLTVARKVPRPKDSQILESRRVESVAWTVGRFVLVRSVSALEGERQGVHYEVIREWSLGY